MDEVHNVFVDARLLQGAPLMPAEVVQDESVAHTILTELEWESDNAGVEPEPEPNTLAAQGKVVVRKAVVSGRADQVLGTAVQLTERTKEGIEVFQKILALTKSRLNADPEAEALSDLSASQLELFWKFIQAPEFQNLTASLLAKMLQ